MEADFVAELDDFLRCPICRHCLKEPMQTHCGHRFCRECIARVNQSPHPQCPIDRIELTLFPDAACERQISALKVYCPNKNSGCTWIGDLVDEKLHLNSCQYSKIPCRFCGKGVLNSDKAHHESELCPTRPATCKYCSRRMEYQLLDDHYKNCEEFPVICPNNCGTEPLARAEMNQHLTENCLRVKEPCPLRAFGCSETIERQHQAAHLQQCSMLHLSQLAKTILELQEKVKQLEIAQHKSSTVATSCSGRFVWKLEGISDKIARVKDPIYSEDFYSHEGGYKMCLCVYPSGDSNNQALSLYFVLAKGPYDAFLAWPFSYTVILTLVNARNPSTSIKKIITPVPDLRYFKQPTTPRNAGYGYPAFITHSKLLDPESGFVQDNSILFCTTIQRN